MAGLVLWLVGGSALGGILLIKHMIALPTPALGDPTLRDILAATTRPGRWREVHFMYQSCNCSRRTIKHLLETPRDPEVDQVVVMVDDDGAPGAEDAPLRAGGFPVTLIKPEELRTRYHVEAAPVLVVITPEDELAYIGGYNRHKQSLAYEDREILAELRAHRAAAPLPVFGCATSARLAQIVDPLHLPR